MRTSIEIENMVTSLSPVELVDENEKEYQQCWLDRASKKLTAEQEESAQEIKEEIRSKLRGISDQVAVLVKENSLRNPNEQLENSEFTIDTQLIEEVKASANEEINQIVQQNKDEIEKKMSEINNINRECRDTLSVQESKLKSFLNPRLVVRNIPVRKQTLEQARKTQISILLRRTEICDIRSHVSNASKNGLCWSVLTHNTTSLPDPSDFQQSIIAVQPTSVESGSLNEIVESSSDETDWSEKFVDINADSSSQTLLYPPLSVRTDAQRRTQITLLQCVIRLIVSEFNGNFDQLETLHEQFILEIESKNERRIEILNDLGREDSSIFHGLGETANCTKKNIEQDGGDNQGIPTALDDASRALMDMMNGTLKSKKKVLLKVSIRREPWMIDVAYDDMTIEQRHRFDECRRKEQESAEQIEKSRAALDFELQTLSDEILGAVGTFDTKLESISTMRRNTLSLICTYELYILQLEKALVQNEKHRTICSDMQNQLLNLQEKQQKLSVIAVTTQMKLRKFQDECNIFAEQCKALDRGFRRKIQQYSKVPLDQQTLKILFGLFKKGNADQIIQRGLRESFENNSQEGKTKSLDKDNLQREVNLMTTEAVKTTQHDKEKLIIFINLSNDPFPEAVPLEKTSNRPQNEPLQLANVPENCQVTKELLDGLQIMRDERLLYEETTKNAAEAELQVRTEYDAANQMLDSCTLQVSNLRKELNEAVQKARNEISQGDVLVQIKQGQDETTSTTYPSYPNSILIPSSLITEANELIISLSEQKISFLKKTQKFRKEIQFMHWCHEYLDLLIADAKESYIDYQFLHIDKKLMKYLAGIKEESDEVKMSRAEAKQEKRTNMHIQIVEKMQHECRALQNGIDAKDAENNILKQRIHELQSEVIEMSKRDIRNIDLTKKSTNAAENMKYITERLKLVSQIKLQAEEVVELEKEVSRLKRKTFPTFPGSTSIRRKNPDEKD